jgi:hypothetical protein
VSCADLGEHVNQIRNGLHQRRRVGLTRVDTRNRDCGDGVLVDESPRIELDVGGVVRSRRTIETTVKDLVG